jgi:UDP-N-acetylenolpyruvoylglucosamine reductase
MDKPHSKREQASYKKRKSKTQTNKILDRLTFSLKKHKQKVTRKLRQKLQQKTLPSSTPVSSPTTLKFGSFNVNGLDLEASWAVEELLRKHGFDVRFNKNHLINLKIIIIFNRFWL